MNVDHVVPNDLILGTATYEDDTITMAAAATLAKGTMLARNTTSKKLTVYSDAGANGENEPCRILTHELVFADAGDMRTRVLVDGKVDKTKLIKHEDATAIDILVLDKLISNSGIVPINVRDHSAYDND